MESNALLVDKLFAELQKAASDNFAFYLKVKVKELILRQNFQEIWELAEEISEVVDQINGFAGTYDFDEKTLGNGYRSFVFIVEKAVERVLKIAKGVQEKRENVFFRKGFYEKEATAYIEVLRNLLIIGRSLLDIHKNQAEAGSLFSEVGRFDNSMRRTMDSLNLEAFYGRAFGFQHPRSVRFPLKLLAVLMATSSDFFYSNQHKALKLLRMPYSWLQYYFCSKRLSRRLVDLFENSELDFLKSLLRNGNSKVYIFFQDLSEIRIDVNEVFLIPPHPLFVYSEKHEKLIEIAAPSCHIGVSPVRCRLQSAKRRQGMMKVGRRRDAVEPSQYLIVQGHGGGWATQTSRFHGAYLREWAAKMDVPIMSVDYSLAPKAPFPRAVEEVFFAYCWALKNPELLGSTGENIIFAGDSAGANLMTAVTIKCIEMGVPKPKGLFNVYAVHMPEYATVPSRLECSLEVILPYMTYMRLFQGYHGHVAQTSSEQLKNREIPKTQIDPNEVLPRHHLASPLRASDEILKQFPPTSIISTNMDPCLDDCVEFARKLKKLEVKVQLDVLSGLCHGFLYMTSISKECNEGTEVCIKRMNELLEKTDHKLVDD